jgi:signal transduction histidine kinase
VNLQHEAFSGWVTAIRRGEYQPADGGGAAGGGPASGGPAAGGGPASGGPSADGVRRDELGRLAAEFDRMAEDLARSREALMDEAEKRLQVERGLRRFDRMATLGQLTSNLAHEVGTPLGVLRGRAEFLAGEVADRPEARRIRSSSPRRPHHAHDRALRAPAPHRHRGADRATTGARRGARRSRDAGGRASGSRWTGGLQAASSATAMGLLGCSIWR